MKIANSGYWDVVKTDPIDKTKLIVKDVVMRKSEVKGKVLTQIISEHGEYNIKELAEELETSLYRLTTALNNVESLTINNIHYKVVLKSYNVNIYKDGELHLENITADKAALEMGCSSKRVGSLRSSKETNPSGWSVRYYEERM